jgi:hypothetical protein
MLVRKMTAALAALALAAAPAGAAAQVPAPEPAAETVEGSEMRGASYWIVPALVVIAILIAILAGEEEPNSP